MYILFFRIMFFDIVYVLQAVDLGFPCTHVQCWQSGAAYSLISFYFLKRRGKQNKKKKGINRHYKVRSYLPLNIRQYKRIWLYHSDIVVIADDSCHTHFLDFMELWTSKSGGR